MTWEMKAHEEKVATLLTDPSVSLTPNDVRSLMSVVLLSCYDHKVKREFMAEVIDATAEVNILMSRLESGAKLKAAFSQLKPDLDTKQIDEELKNIAMQWITKKNIIAKKFDLVRQCKDEGDTVH